jgi:hypothetical protein
MSARRRTAAVVLLALVALVQTGQSAASATALRTTQGPVRCC